MLSESRTQPLTRLLSLVAALLIVSQLLEIWLTMVTGGIDPGSAEWRLRMFGVVSQRIPMLVLGDVVLFAGLLRLENRAAVQRLGWIHLLLTPILGVALLVMARDVLALRSKASGRSVDVAGLRAGVTIGLATVLSLLAGWFAVRNFRKHKWDGRTRLATPLFTDTENTGSPNRGG